MIHREKHALATKHQDAKFIEADKELLKQHAPTSMLLPRDYSTPLGSTLPFDLVYRLLDSCSMDEILANRKKHASATVQNTEGKGSSGKSNDAKAAKKSAEKEKKLTKQEEFPKINWNDLSDQDVQKAELIYSDRINTFRRLKEIDSTLDDNPTEDAIAEMVELDIRNRICREELTSFNNKGKWLNKHPLFNSNNEHNKLTKLLLQNPGGFMDKYNQVKGNITRYKSYLQSKKYTKEQHERQQQLLDGYVDKENLMADILQAQIYEQRKGKNGTAEAGRV